jgi:hypothetical protein
MTKQSALTAARLAHFKGHVNDENTHIAKAIRAIMPPPAGGGVLDVGAGLGDIAAHAFPERAAELIDILAFPPSPVDVHRRAQIDFFDYQPTGAYDVMVLSHVLQYLDDDLNRLVNKVREISPRFILVVSNRPTSLGSKIEDWFSRHKIEANGERIFKKCPLSEYRLIDRRAVTGTLRCGSIGELALQLSGMIYDVELDGRVLSSFCDWLELRLKIPLVKITQHISLYGRDENEV